MSERQQVADLRGLLEEKTPSEQIAMASKMTSETQFYAGYVSIAVFMAMWMPEYFKIPFGVHHGAFCGLIDDPTRCRKENIIAPRRAAKSCFFIEGHLCHKLFYKSTAERVGEFPEQYIMVISRVERLAVRRITITRKLIETKFPHLVNRGSWGKKEWESSNGTLVLAIARAGAVRGETHNTWRITLFLCDDVDDRESLRNPQRVEDDWDWFNNDLLPAGDESYTNAYVVDTIKGSEAISNKLRRSTEWNTHYYQAISQPASLVHPTHEQLWQDYKNIYTDLMKPPEVRKEAADRFFEHHRDQMMESVQETWPANIEWKYKSLREKSYDRGVKAVLMEYQNEPENLENALFDMANAVTFTIEADGLHRSDERVVPWDRIAGATSHLDWAGSKEAQDHAYSPVVTVVFEPTGRTEFNEGEYKTQFYAYVIRDLTARGTREEQIRNLVNEHLWIKGVLESHGVRGAYNITTEDVRVADQTGDVRENFERHYREIAAKMQCNLSLQFVSSTTHKLDRIDSLEAPISNGYLAFCMDLSEEYLAQMQQYPEHPFFDCPDATEAAMRTPVVKTARQRQRDLRLRDHWAERELQKTSMDKLNESTRNIGQRKYR